MSSQFSQIFSRLARQGILARPESLHKYRYQGLMSTVYMVDSNVGRLIIHMITPGREWVHQRIWEKLAGIAEVLKNYPEIPSAEFIVVGKIGIKYFLVQKKLPGHPAGKRRIVHDDVFDIRFQDSRGIKYRQRFLPQLLRIIMRVHQVKVSGYGWLRQTPHGIGGGYRSWKNFFEKESDLWLRSLGFGDARLRNKKYLNISAAVVKKILPGVFKRIPRIQPVLIHGDAINPSNILMEKGRIVGLLDWEWSIAGDPAWEFCDPGWWPYLNGRSLRPYFHVLSYTKAQVRSFLRRARSYRLLWILWGCHLHAYDRNLIVYRALRKMLNVEAIT